jgi:hypothetical protein
MRKGVLMACAALLAVTTTHIFAQSTTSFVTYATANRGGFSVETVGGTDPLVVGYGRAFPSSSSTPAGVAILSFEQNGVLVSEVGEPGTTAITSGRTYAEINGSINTAVAFVNPTGLPVLVSFHFTNAAGRDVNTGTFTLNPSSQIAKFLSDAPFNAAAFTGTFTFTAPSPVAVSALRTLINGRNEFMATGQPVISLPSSTSAGTVFIPHFVDGAGWRTQVLLVNPTDSAITGTVEFLSEGSATAVGLPIVLTANGTTTSLFNYTIAAGSAVSLLTSGQNVALAAGTVRVTPTGGTTPPLAFDVFSFVSNGVAESLTTTQSQAPANVFRSYAEMRDATTESDQIQSAIAISNTSAPNATVNFELTTLDGTAVVQTASVNIAGFGHVSRFVRDLFPTIDLPFQGVLRMSSFSSVSVAAFRTHNNERGTLLMATTPVTNEALPATTTDMFFPQIADRGGYKTQFILFSGVAAQNTTGTLRFFRPDGQDLNLVLR